MAWLRECFILAESLRKLCTCESFRAMVFGRYEGNTAVRVKSLRLGNTIDYVHCFFQIFRVKFLVPKNNFSGKIQSTELPNLNMLEFFVRAGLSVCWTYSDSRRSGRTLWSSCSSTTPTSGCSSSSTRSSSSWRRRNLRRRASARYRAVVIEVGYHIRLF